MRTLQSTQNSEPPPPSFLPSHEIEQISCGLLHDLINPITGLTLYLENALPEKYKSVLHPIKSTSTVIRDFIDIMRDALEKKRTREKVHIGHVAEHVMKLLSHKALCARVTLMMTQDSSKAALRGRKTELYQILINLVSNAIDSFEKISREKNRVVTISISSNTHHHTIIVTDNGKGIPAHIFKKLFKRYYSDKIIGSGIGLMHTHKIVKELGGSIYVKTECNEGTQFTITLPKRESVIII